MTQLQVRQPIDPALQRPEIGGAGINEFPGHPFFLPEFIGFCKRFEADISLLS